MSRHAPVSRIRSFPWSVFLWSLAGAMAIGAVVMLGLGAGGAVSPAPITETPVPTYGRPEIPSIGAPGAWDPTASSTSSSPSTVTETRTSTRTVYVTPRLTSPPPTRPPAAPGTRTVTETRTETGTVTETRTETSTATATETVTAIVPPPPIIEEIP